MYFCLHNHCKLVEGAKRAAIYDLHSGKVFSINKGAAELLTAGQNTSLDYFKEDQTCMNFFHDLITKELGAICSSPSEEQGYTAIPSPKKLQSIVLEVTSRCNNTCIHCYTSSSLNTPASLVPHERWLAVIREAHLSGAKSIQLIGGEPLLYPKWRELVLKAKDEGFKAIEIFTNATLITDSDIDFFKANNVIISTSIYAGHAEIHDQITLNQGSFSETSINIKKLLANGIQLRIYSVIMKTNESELESIRKLCTELGLKGIAPPAVRAVGRGANKKLVPEKYTSHHIKPPFYTNELSFAEAHYYHSTLAGTITISYTGDAIPCIFSRTTSFGSILTNSLPQILSSEQVNAVWHTTKDLVEKCKDCEYRYACHDCRCRPITPTADIATPPCPTACSYNPYSGEWTD